MKPRVCKKTGVPGSVLIVTLLVASLFGLFLFYYLNLVRSQRVLVARSQAWNLALGYAESGAEEVLAHLNPGVPLTNINRSGNGWGSPSGNLYGPTTRNFSSGSYSVSFTDDRWPVIYSTGSVTVAAIPATLARVIRVGTTNTPLFTAALAARNNIDFSGNGVMTDSFDSRDPNFSLDGRYYAPRASTNGDIASFQGIVGVANGNVNGSVLLGPTATDTIGSMGLVTGGVRNDFNFEFDDVIVPQASWMLPPIALPRTINGVTYQYVFDGPTAAGDYAIASLNGGIYIGTNTIVRLKLIGNASCSGIKVDGGKLDIYMTGSTFSMSGTSGADGGYASSLSYWGTTNNTRINWTGNASLTGTIYAPQADLNMTGGGSSDYDVVGALVVRSAAVTGHFKFHFDEALWHEGPQRPYVAVSWAEL